MNIEIYTDGSCDPNPGYGAVGVLLKYGEHIKKFGKYIGESTNNIAELTAIQEGLLAVKDKTKNVIVYTDSQYCIGVLTNNQWQPKKNVDLILFIKKIMSEFSSIKFEKVKGHAGNEFNEIVDKLANEARNRR